MHKIICRTFARSVALLNAYLLCLFRLIGKPLIIDFSQQSAENCLCLDLDMRFGSVDLCECLQPDHSNVQRNPSKETNQMVFNRVRVTSESTLGVHFCRIETRFKVVALSSDENDVLKAVIFPASRQCSQCAHTIGGGREQYLLRIG